VNPAGGQSLRPARTRPAVGYGFTHVCTVTTVTTVTQTRGPDRPGDPRLVPGRPVPAPPEPELPRTEPPEPELRVPKLPGLEPGPGAELEPEPGEPPCDAELAVPEPELVPRPLADPPDVPGEWPESAAEVVPVPLTVPEPASGGSADVDAAEPGPVGPETEPARAAFGVARAGRRRAADDPCFAGGRDPGRVPGTLVLWPMLGPDAAGPAANPPMTGV